MSRILCVDAGGTFVKWAVMDAHDEIEDKGSVPTPVDDREAFLALIENLYRTHEDIQGIAFSVPGIVIPETGYMRSAGAIPCLYECELAELVSARCGNVPVSVENDGKAGARAEMVSGALQDCQNGAVIILGTGIAGTIFIDRKIIRGPHLFAGELSYMYRDNSNIREDIPNEAYGPLTLPMRFMGRVTPAALVRRYCEMSGEELQATDCPLLFERMEAGDQTAYTVIREAAHDLAMMIMNIQAVIDPDAFALGGGISAQDSFIGMVQESVKMYKPVDKPICVVPDVRVCKYRGSANLYGALYAFREKYGE